ncbi:MAG: class I SAM-dependent methyltransferase, partial [Desulfobacterales bacterium]|nr:class I SAM-dependent methyltransferase [Desulfobacterales bacterium]
GPLAPREGVSVTESERAPFRLQAENDLRRFYAARAEELVNGGKLLVQVFGRDERFFFIYCIYAVLRAPKLDSIDEGLLPRASYEELTYPIYFRSLDELVAPIETDAQLAGAFRVENAGSREVPVPFNIMLAETGDEASWARSYTGFLRAFTEAILISALPDGLHKSHISARIYERVEQRLAADPARYKFHYISVAALLTRI